MATKKEKKILEIANKGNWTYFNGEDRCDHCGEYRFTDAHEDDCPLGALLEILKKGGIEE